MLTQLLSRLIRSGLAGRGETRAEAVLDQVRELLAAGRTEQALDRLRFAARTWPAHAEAHRLLGSALGASGRFEEARASLEQALTLVPRDAAALMDLANVHRLQGRFAEAEARYRDALSLDIGNRSARLNLAMLQVETGCEADAIQGLSTLLETPALPEAVKSLIALLDRLGRHAEAKAACEKVLASEPGHAGAHAALGFVLLKRDLRPAQALIHLDFALAFGQQDAEAGSLLIDDHDFALGKAMSVDDDISRVTDPAVE